jgi:hypothetical protein
MGVIIYYLDKDLINRSYLIDIRRINEAYINKNIIEAVIPVLIKMDILLKLGYFIANNDGRNDIYIRAILRKYRPNIKDFNSRKVRGLKYIINWLLRRFYSAKT